MEIREILDPARKSSTCEAILRALPSWFGVEASIAQYAQKVMDMPFAEALIEGEPVGFVAVKPHNAWTAEVCVMGVLQNHHRQGAGKALIQWCEAHCRANRRVFLTVKTLDASRASRSYEKTRQFYQAMGFVPLEVFPLFWDEDNPCLFLAKYISEAR